MSTETFLGWNFPLFPSPAQNDLNIHLNNIQNASVVIYSVNGKLILNQPLEHMDVLLDINSLIEGFYFLVVQDDTGNKQIKKFIKK